MSTATIPLCAKSILGPRVLGHIDNPRLRNLSISNKFWPKEWDLNLCYGQIEFCSRCIMLWYLLASCSPNRFFFSFCIHGWTIFPSLPCSLVWSSDYVLDSEQKCCASLLGLAHANLPLLLSSLSPSNYRLERIPRTWQRAELQDRRSLGCWDPVEGLPRDLLNQAH